MLKIEKNLIEVGDEIASACDKVGRKRETVTLVAVSKTFPVDSVKDAFSAGQRVFGESRLQEAELKVSLLPSSIQWHFIGRVQRNKVRKLLQCFPVIHGIDSLKLAGHVDEVSGELGLRPQVFLQVNLGGEESKGGFEVEDLEREMELLLGFKRIDICGLMCIPPAGVSAESSRKWFVALRELRDMLEVEFKVVLPSLSMGMSGDFAVAIEEGATHVRVGSAIFGKRSYRVDGELG
jgi:PLP dependent protein